MNEEVGERMESPFDVSSDFKRCVTEYSSWTPCGNHMTFKLFSLILAETLYPTGYIFCNCGFLSSAGWYLSYWCLEERSGTWQTCSKWNMSESLLIIPHTSYRHPGSNITSNYWECKRALSKRKQEEDGALHCRISQLTAKKGTASAVMAFMVSEVICHKEAFAEIDSTFIAMGHSIQWGRLFPLIFEGNCLLIFGIK